jgi:S-adenosylmethionine decarboxylase
MAFNDTLFQLGMDLTRSSTAQTEDHFGSAHVAQEDWSGTVTSDDVARSAGQKLYIDLVGAKHAHSAKSAERAARHALEIALGVTGRVAVRRTDKGSLVGRADLAGGHATFEAWPAHGYVAFDLETARPVRPEHMLTALMDAFSAREATIKRLRHESDGARYKRPAAAVGNSAAARAQRRAA